MCGIAGLIDFQGDARRHRDTYDNMLDCLECRGPDENGTYLTERACLVHARLSVVDLAHGKQPMVGRLEGRELALVYNGELYNTMELRGELEGLGHRFEETSDTEVLLHAYSQWGEKCVDRFNGIYAFAVWDAHAGTLFAARDRMGVKPFFFAQVGGGVVFASEIKCLLTHPDLRPEIDREGVAELFLLGPGRTPGCGVFRQIRELRPGERMTVGAGGVHIEQYFSLRAEPHRESFADTVEHVRWLIQDAIRRQTVSDVPLCAFLSGGLDSSAITAISGVGETFSVDYRDNDRYFQKSKFQPDSDGAYIQRMTAFLGTEHTNIVVDTEELVQALFEAVEARDLPGMADVDASLLLFCRQVKGHATVALSGECADELFGGYPWYRDPDVRDAEGFPWSQNTGYRATFLRPELAVAPGKYVMDRYAGTLAETDTLAADDPLEKRMRQMVRLNTDWFMQTLLDRKDRMSMRSGLEVRVPFCDHRIAQYLYNVPWEMKNYRGREKGLLRQALTGLLPEEVLWRKKSPYPKTHNPNYLNAVSGLLRDIIASPNAPILELCDKAALERLLDGGENATPWYGQLMTVPQTIAYFVQMNHWLETYHVRVAVEATR